MACFSHPSRMSYQRLKRTIVIEPGSFVAERYVVGNVLGRGGSSVVYEGFDLVLEEEVAVKVLDPEPAHRRTERDRMYREARLAGRIAHPAIVKVTDAGPLADGGAYLVMERLFGHTLAERLEAVFWLDLEEAFDLAEQLLVALEVAHAHGVVHRDVNPRNVHVGEHGRLKLIDFGISRPLGDPLSRVTAEDIVVGTLGYMAPEQLFGDEPTAASDIYAAGATLYEMFGGRPPHDIRDGDLRGVLRAMSEDPVPLGELRPAMPEALVSGIMSALARRPDDRPSSAQALLQACDFAAARAA